MPKGPHRPYDPKHPGPYALDIHPTHISHDGEFLIEVRSITANTLNINWKRTSDEMKRIHCDACTRCHIDTRLHCSANHPDMPPFLQPELLNLPHYHYLFFELDPTRCVLGDTVWTVKPDGFIQDKVHTSGMAFFDAVV